MAERKKKATYKYNYYDSDGKRRCKTFTASTKAKARRLSEIWEEEHVNEDKHVPMTVLSAVNAYINNREPVLSPVTTRQYRSIVKTHIEPDLISLMPLSSLTGPVVQAWVNSLVEGKAKPKTVKNIFGLLRPAVKMYDKRIQLDDVRLPQSIMFQGHTPGDSEVQMLIENIKDKDRDLYIAVLLGAFGPMRRSEICALTSEDIKGNSVSVHKAKVPGISSEWVIKETPKTDAANRTIIFPAFVMKELKGIDGEIIKCTPTAITKRFQRELKKAGLPACRFHDLRHYGASIMHAMKVPDVYIIKRGGWSSDHVMKRIYRNALDDEQKKQTDIINSHFTDLVQVKQKSEAKTATT